MIDTKDLYIVKIKNIKSVRENAFYKVSTFSKGYYYIAARKEYDYFIDIFTNESYKDSKSLDHTDIYPGLEVPTSSKSILLLMKTKSSKISKEELIDILNSKNRDNKRSVSNMDIFLNSILMLNSKIKASGLSMLEKNQYISRLLSLSDEYTSAMLSLKNGEFNDGNNQINELKIKERFFRRLIEIENELYMSCNIEIDKYSTLQNKVSRILRSGGKEL